MNIFDKSVYFMSRMIIIFLVSTLFSVFPVFGQNLQNKVNISLDNGKFMQLQLCSDNIIRVRESAKNDFPETLLERYEIITMVKQQ